MERCMYLARDRGGRKTWEVYSRRANKIALGSSESINEAIRTWIEE